jgi:hypothetical protein
MKAIAARARLEPFPGEAYKRVARDPQASRRVHAMCLRFAIPAIFES